MNKSSGKSLVLSWNVWSIANEEKLLNFLHILEDMDIKIACVCETWFDTEKGVFSRLIKEFDYELHHAHREKKKGGGVAILYKNNLSVKKDGASTSIYSSFEFAIVVMTVQAKKIVLVCVYRKQEVSLDLFLQEFSSFMEKILFKGDALLVVGDFNVWVDVEDDPNANKLLTLMHAYGLNQQVQEPTQRSGHTLDQVYLNEFQLQVKHTVINEDLGLTTDHLPLLLELPSCKGNNKTQTILYRKLKNVDIEGFRNDLKEAYDFMETGDHQSFEEMCTQYHQLSASIVDKHSPLLEMKCPTTKPSWIDMEYKQNRALRRKFEREWKKNRTEENKQSYITQK